MRGAETKVIIQPLVLITLDAETTPLSAAVTLRLAASQPHALPLFCSIDIETRVTDPGDLIRHAFEAVTDLAERQNALLAGNRLEDRIRVVFAFFLGSPQVEELLASAIETVHCIAGNFFDQTAVDVHVIAFLPDLAREAVREERYQNAYRQLCQLDALGATPASPARRTHFAIDYRWLLDCRTRAGAHAGTLDEVLEPAARLVTLLMDGEAERIHSAGNAAASGLHATALGRRTAYSSFGAATVFHEPDVLLRALAARAALDHLALLTTYGSSSAPSLESEPAAAESGRLGRADVDAVVRAFTSWAERAGLRAQFAEALDPQVASLDPSEDPAALTLQAQYAAHRLEQLERSATDAVKRWLADHGIGFARQVLRAASGTLDEDDDLPVMVPGLSLTSLRTEHRAALRAFLEIDSLRLQRDRLDVVETQEQESGLDALESVTAERARIDALLSQRRALLDNAIDADALHAALEQIDPLHYDALPVASPAPATQPTTPTAPDPPPRGRWARLLDRIFGATVQGAFESMLQIEQAASPTPAAASHLPALGAWALAEQKRWLIAYGHLLGRLRRALNAHGIDLDSAASFYENVACQLERQVTERSNFRLPALSRADLDRYQAAYVPALRDALHQAAAVGSLTRSFELEPPMASELGNLTQRFADFDATLMDIARKQLASLSHESVAALLRHETAARQRFRPVDVVRALIETSEPLVRPASIPDIASPRSVRWLLAHPDVHACLAANSEAHALLQELAVLHFQTSDARSFTLCAVLHGFSAFAVQKVLELRFRAAPLGADRCEPYPDVVPLDVARAHPVTQRIFRTLVIAKALGLITTIDHSVEFDDAVMPGDLMDLAHAIAHESGYSGVEREIDRQVGALLAQSDGVERLRRALHENGLGGVEQRIVLELIADLEVGGGLLRAHQENGGDA